MYFSIVGLILSRVMVDIIFLIIDKIIIGLVLFRVFFLLAFWIGIKCQVLIDVGGYCLLYHSKYQ